ncbi:allantoin permease [Marmoricola endophyticus]|uniref:Allantoin permease n=1 Tax=Marmoricola endophyticus TaxID=2040280 RepID=A0A917FA24_9ACTN|nr:cytosine permease [Marmoricola endophyticus]GGF56696.1 allantoin permease [Marmoricola endophyticus]
MSVQETAPAPGRVETNGVNVIAEAERRGRPRDLFWPWTAASISVFGISYGSFALGYGVSAPQALVAGLVGIVAAGLLAGLIAIAGKRGSAPTLVLSRAAFGVHGNRVPAAFSWVLSVGWETVLTSLAALAAATVVRELGGSGGNGTLAIALVVVIALIVGGGFLGFDAIMRIQTWITYVGVVLTVVYVVLVADRVDLSAVGDLPGGGVAALVGVGILMATATGLSWVNAAADYSRYLPRSASGRGVAGWTATGLSVASVVLFVVGIALAGSDARLSEAIGGDPIGALASLLPTWFLVPFVVVAVVGLVSGALLDIYSSGLSLLALGLPVSRPTAALLDGAIMVLGSVYVLFVAPGDFVNQFQGFLITLGVPIAAWAGVMVADIALRRRDYDDAALMDPAGRYGAVGWPALAVFGVGTVVGWGLVTNTYAGWLTWQGYLMGLVGGKDGAWAGASLGVVVALVIGVVGYAALAAGRVRRSEG